MKAILPLVFLTASLASSKAALIPATFHWAGSGYQVNVSFLFDDTKPVVSAVGKVRSGVAADVTNGLFNLYATGLKPDGTRLAFGAGADGGIGLNDWNTFSFNTVTRDLVSGSLFDVGSPSLWLGSSGSGTFLLLSDSPAPDTVITSGSNYSITVGSVPDGGSSAALLSGVLGGLLLAGRKLRRTA